MNNLTLNKGKDLFSTSQVKKKYASVDGAAALSAAFRGHFVCSSDHIITLPSSFFSCCATAETFAQICQATINPFI